MMRLTGWFPKQLLLALLIASAAIGGETVIYPGAVLQDVAAYPNSVAPSGSASNKSNSISGNTVIINGGSAENAAGAVNWVDSAAVTGNQVIVNGGTVSGTIVGATSSMRDDSGSGFGSATTNSNSVTVNGGTVGFAYGGYADISAGALTATANNNSVFVNGGTVNDYIGGGYATSASGSAMAHGNTVTVSGGTVGAMSGQIFGASATVTYGVGHPLHGSASASAVATNNRVSISGGLINSFGILGGKAAILDNSGGYAAATHNTVTISGNPTFTANPVFYGGLVTDDGGVNQISGDAFTGNRLNVWNYHGSAIGSAQNFQFYNFTLPAGFQSGDTALTVNKSVNFQDGNNAANASAIEAVNFMGGGRVQQAGEVFNLMNVNNLTADATDGITGTIANNGQTLTGKKGVSLLYDIQINQTIAQAGTDGYDSVTATILGGPRLNPQTKALSEGYLAGMALLNQGADFVAGAGMSDAVFATISTGGGTYFFWRSFRRLVALQHRLAYQYVQRFSDCRSCLGQRPQPRSSDFRRVF
jgi:hypothetical protein